MLVITEVFFWNTSPFPISITVWPYEGRTTSIYIKHKTLLKRCRITEERSTGEWIKEGGATGLEAPQLYFSVFQVQWPYFAKTVQSNSITSESCELCRFTMKKWEKKPFLWEDTSLNLEKARPVRPEICTCGFTTMSTWHLRILYLTTTKCSCPQLKIWQLQISHCFFVDRTIMKNSKKSKIALFSTTGLLEVATDWPVTSDHPSHPLLQDKAPKAHCVQYFWSTFESV